jgi:hypothetical protein
LSGADGVSALKILARLLSATRIQVGFISYPSVSST